MAPFTTSWVIVFTLAILYPTAVQSSESARAIYNQLERLQDDTKALHETRAPSWVDAPNMRGTSSILYSCLLTLVTCIYTALHLDIPNHSSSFHFLLKKVGWVALALFAPEIVLWFAAHQFLQARHLTKELRKKLKARDPGDSDVCKIRSLKQLGIASKIVQTPPTSTHDTISAKLKVRGWPNPDIKTHILSPKGVIQLADHDIDFLRVPRSLIVDRSKADTLQKILILFQVSWMALECVTRKAYGLPLCLLELHTMVHVICAIFMYASWFEVGIATVKGCDGYE
ncbi:hypothetical protein QBC38DRAFT_375509 [Podospora fimiseda]|uniref:Uncharacterized protein n=1 Tax=Podospora fimiseda TaxID=252190 RepID=A0AAN6YQW0_9PEZI|nr:hypothetical protein QBC38DRAFT_375509 [Podospora fimiseda]